MYSAYYIPQTIYNFTKVINKQVQDFKKRSLAQQYAVVYQDVTYLPLWRNSVVKEAVHLVIGIQSNRHKEVLGYHLVPIESSSVSTELLLCKISFRIGSPVILN